jgi:hypothetical protein
MGDRSAYEVLGLEPEADDAATERAYRQLIKRFHPDRGGDASRAMEINRAYDELRRDRNLRDPLDFNEIDEERAGGSRAWLWLALVLAGSSIFLVLQSAPPLDVAKNNFPMSRGVTTRVSPSPMNRPLEVREIDRSAAEAQHLKQTSDELGLAAHSRACHAMLRDQPTIARFDRCVAFDSAVVQLQDRDPLRDQGPFSELAVTGRVRSAAALLSDDAVGADARQDGIRRQVERDLRLAIAN